LYNCTRWTNCERAWPV